EDLEGRLPGALVLRERRLGPERHDGLAQHVVVAPVDRDRAAAGGSRARLLKLLPGEVGEGQRVHGRLLRSWCGGDYFTRCMAWKLPRDPDLREVLCLRTVRVEGLAGREHDPRPLRGDHLDVPGVPRGVLRAD